MPNRCNVNKCRSNYRNEPYTKIVSFPPKGTSEYYRWIEALPNERQSLLDLAQIHVCVKHFPADVEWITIPGGKRPAVPPSIFAGVDKSCLKQTTTTKRPTQAATSESRALRQKERDEASDKIGNFESFCDELPKRHKQHHIIRRGNELYLSRTDDIGRKVLEFIHFRHVDSHFGFLHLVCAEKNGVEVPKSRFELQKNSLLSKWSQISFILSVIEKNEAQPSDYHKIALDALECMSEHHDSPHFQFIKTQLQLLLCAPKGRRFDKNLVVLAAELHNISPAAYKMLRKSGSIVLPSIKLIKKLLSNTLNDANLTKLFQSLKNQQRLVNILFDEVKLVQTTRFTGGHIVGHAQNVTGSDVNEVLATHALVVEIVCHFGGPKYILRVCPVAKLNADGLRDIILEATHAIVRIGGTPISLICDNHSTNQSFYSKLGGPGKVHLEAIGRDVFLVYDYVHIFKNIRNNWLTVPNQQLSFVKDGKQYTAYWSDIKALYEEDRLTAIRLTKLTHTAVFPKPLQRQSVPLVCQVFNDKTVAALSALKTKLKIHDGTIIFVSMIRDWFTMMNVKNKYSAVHLRDPCRAPWTLNCESFKKLDSTCEVISSCTWKGGKGRALKLTKQTGTAFVISTKTNVLAATHLLENEKFDYVLPAVNADENLEKFFGIARMRNRGNFYIDAVDILAAAKVFNLHSLLTGGILPTEEAESSCETCSLAVNEDEIEKVHELTVADTQTLLSSDDTYKHKIVYIAGHLVHKFGGLASEDDFELSSEFTDALDRGGLSLPTLSTVFFVHSAFTLYAKLDVVRKRCRTYVKRSFGYIVSPWAGNDPACKTLANILLKACVLNNSDRERELGCLRRKEKLAK